MNKNIRIYAWLQEVFGSNSFTVDEFRAVFPSSQATKTLFDLAKLGFLIRIKKRVYKTIEPAEFIRKIVEENSKAEYALQKSDKKYAYCGNDAVIIWTQAIYANCGLGIRTSFKFRIKSVCFRISINRRFVKIIMVWRQGILGNFGHIRRPRIAPSFSVYDSAGSIRIAIIVAIICIQSLPYLLKVMLSLSVMAFRNLSRRIYNKKCRRR